MGGERIPKTGTIAWHKYHIDRLRKLRSKAAKSRVYENKDVGTEKENVYKRVTKKPNARYRSRIDYDFLMYIRVVFKWAVDNSGLTRPNIELLLYLYGLGAFSKKQFHDFHKLIGMYQDKKLQDLIDQGWIKIYRVKKGREHGLYVLTQKGKRLCNSMHKYSAGLEEIPTIVQRNKMLRDDAPRVNTYYMDIIKRMNKNKATE